MRSIRWVPVVAGLVFSLGASAAGQLPGPAVAPLDKVQWITTGVEAVEPIRAAFKQAKQTDLEVVTAKGDLIVLKVRESQLPILGSVMHNTFNRCAGFLTHETEQEAITALTPAPPHVSPALVSYTLDNPVVANQLIGAIQEAPLVSVISSLAAYNNRYYTQQTAVDAANWLKTKWESYGAGRSDVSVALFTHTWLMPSVIMTIQGTTLPNEVVVMGGHLDSINGSSPSTGRAPGADDDASGIASLSEAVRVALAAGYKPARTIKVIGYAAEEVGLKGSAAIAANFKSTGVNVVGVLQLDMTNYHGSVADVGMMTDFTNAAQNTFVRNLLDTYVGATWVNDTCGYACSDHASWNAQGFAASMPFESRLGEDNPQIHTANDTLAQSGGTGTHAVKFSKLAAAFMAELAKGCIGTVCGGGGGGGTAQTGTYDSVLKTVKCGTVGSSCESASLLNGRGTRGPESNAPNTIGGTCLDGNSGTYHADESNDALKVSTTDGTLFAPGKTVRVEATVWAFSTTDDKLDLYYAANANSPTWTLIGTLSPSGTGAQTLSTNFVLPSGALQAVRARFRYQGSVGPCTTGNYDDHDDLVFAVGGGGTPDTTPPAATITSPIGGATVSATVNVTATATDNVGVTQVDLYVDGAFKGSDTTSPYSIAWNTSTATNGSHSLTVKALDAAGNVGTSAAVAVTVNNVTSTAVYDATLKAPRCSTAGSVCDSGTLLNGRGTKGPESNAPNTINTSCADGASGTYHSDESNDRIKVSTVDGTVFAAGKSVKVEATVWAYSTPSSDKLDLYYAANAASPVWTLIGTLTPTAGGAQTLSATYTLPSGALQAVRARFRYQGSAAACGTGGYDDHDDLVFAVGNPLRMHLMDAKAAAQP